MIYSNNAYALDIANFCYNKLKLVGEVDINVRPLDANGYCYEDGLVEINETLSHPIFGITVCHELVHCAQYEQRGHTDEEEAYKLENTLFNEYLKSSGRSIGVTH